jgi:hypothetical protein
MSLLCSWYQSPAALRRSHRQAPARVFLTDGPRTANPKMICKAYIVAEASAAGGARTSLSPSTTTALSADPVLAPAPQQRRRLRGPELTSLEVEEERRRRRERELATARDDEINDLIQRTRCLAAEVEEFVKGMRNTVLYGKTREEGQSLYDESSKCVREILMLRGVNL